MAAFAGANYARPLHPKRLKTVKRPAEAYTQTVLTIADLVLADHRPQKNDPMSKASFLILAT
jgi:hypothetical protein